MTDTNKLSIISQYLQTLEIETLGEVASILDVNTHEIASVLENESCYVISCLCSELSSIDTDELWKRLFSNAYPELYDVYSSVVITDNLKEFHDRYRPPTPPGMKETSRTRYHFWEHLYTEMESIACSESDLSVLLQLVRDGKITTDDIWGPIHTLYRPISSYPFLSVFTASLYRDYRQMLVSYDSDAYMAFIPTTDDLRLASTHITGATIARYLLGRSDFPHSLLRNIMMCAARKGLTDVVKLLLGTNQLNIEEKQYMLGASARHGHTDTVRLLLTDDSIDPSNRNNDAIKEASQHGHTGVLRVLLKDERVDPAVGNNRPITLAVSHSQIEAVSVLLEDSRVNPADPNNSALIAAMYSKSHSKIAILLLQDHRISPSLQHALEMAIGRRDNEMIYQVRNAMRIWTER